MHLSCRVITLYACVMSRIISLENYTLKNTTRCKQYTMYTRSYSTHNTHNTHSTHIHTVHTVFINRFGAFVGTLNPGALLAVLAAERAVHAVVEDGPT